MVYFSWILYDRPNFEGDINVVMEGDKLTDFKYSSIKPLKYVRNMVINKTSNKNNYVDLFF